MHLHIWLCICTTLQIIQQVIAIHIILKEHIFNDDFSGKSNHLYKSKLGTYTYSKAF